MGNVPEWRKRRWAGIKKHNKQQKRRKQARRKRVAELWASGEFSRRELTVLLKVSYDTICRDIKAIMAGLEVGGTCFLCGGVVHTLPDRKVLRRTAAAHRRLADLLDSGDVGLYYAPTGLSTGGDETVKGAR